MSMVRACSNKYTRDRLDFVRPQLVWEMSSCSEMNETAFFFSVGLVSFFCFLSQVTLIILITFRKLRR